MTDPDIEQIRYFRLHNHHLDTWYSKAETETVAGACGMQNSPPGAWQTALHNRVPGYSLKEMDALLSREKTLIQAWSLRGAPLVFPASESDVFLSALRADGQEPWIYTRGITLALDFLQMSFEELFEMLLQVISGLDETVILSKTSLDQTVADRMLPLLPAAKQDLWNHPSMYGSPDKQTVGGAVVSFLLRPASFCGLVVFGERSGSSPTFTSYKNWTGHALPAKEGASEKLVKKYLHCYGPSTVDHFSSWLGCSSQQARRLWNLVSKETEPVIAGGKKAFLLSEDKDLFLSPSPLKRELLLLGAHDPFLDQRDRIFLQPDQTLHKQIWKTVSNPGVIVYRGEAVGVWSVRTKSKGLEIQASLWKTPPKKQAVLALFEEYAAFREQKIVQVCF